MHNFRELNIWKDGIRLSIMINKICLSFPNIEKYGLSSQMRRCSVSIPSNIAEGSSRNSVKDFTRFLRISVGSSYELETQLIIAKELGYILENDPVFDFNNKIQRMIINFIKSINKEK